MERVSTQMNFLKLLYKLAKLVVKNVYFEDTTVISSWDFIFERSLEIITCQNKLFKLLAGIHRECSSYNLYEVLMIIGTVGTVADYIQSMSWTLLQVPHYCCLIHIPTIQAHTDVIYFDISKAFDSRSVTKHIT